MRPIVMVHGFGTSHRMTWVENGWVDILGDAGRDVIGVDLLGHGDAPRPHDPVAYADLGARVRDAVSDAGPPVDAIGFSLGARTLLGEAAAAPDHFGKLVVAGVGANLFRSDSSSPVVTALRAGGGTDTDTPMIRYLAALADLPGNDPEALAACLEAPHPPMDADILGRVTCPVLVVLGDEDFCGPADPLVEALPDATFVELRNTDHARTPKSFEFIDAVLDFLT